MYLECVWVQTRQNKVLSNQNKDVDSSYGCRYKNHLSHMTLGLRGGQFDQRAFPNNQVTKKDVNVAMILFLSIRKKTSSEVEKNYPKDDWNGCIARVGWVGPSK